MSVKLLTEQCFELLRLKGVCIGFSEATLVEMPHCGKSRVTPHFLLSFSELGHDCTANDQCSTTIANSECASQGATSTCSCSTGYKENGAGNCIKYGMSAFCGRSYEI